MTTREHTEQDSTLDDDTFLSCVEDQQDQWFFTKYNRLACSVYCYITQNTGEQAIYLYPLDALHAYHLLASQKEPTLFLGLFRRLHVFDGENPTEQVCLLPLPKEGA